MKTILIAAALALLTLPAMADGPPTSTGTTKCEFTLADLGNMVEQAKGKIDAVVPLPGLHAGVVVFFHADTSIYQGAADYDGCMLGAGPTKVDDLKTAANGA